MIESMSSCLNFSIYCIDSDELVHAQSYNYLAIKSLKKNMLAFLSTFWHPCSKCILMCFKKDMGGCQVWKCPKVQELGQRSSECKFLYIRQILAFLSINYPKL